MKQHTSFFYIFCVTLSDILSTIFVRFVESDKMFESAKFELKNQCSSDAEDEQSMFEKAGPLLETLALDDDDQVDFRQMDITQFLMEELFCNRTEQDKFKEEERSEEGYLDESVNFMLKKKENELDSIKLETDDLLETLLTDEEKQLFAKKKQTQGNVDLKRSKGTKIAATELKVKEKIVLEDCFPSSETNQARTPNQDKVLLDARNTEIKNSAQNNNIKEDPDATDLRLQGDNEDDEINQMLKSVQSRQDLLQEKMLNLKASTDSLKEQLMEERRKWKQEIKETVQLEKKVKNKKTSMQDQIIPNKDTVIQNKTNLFNDYHYCSKSIMKIERELKIRNYQNWLSEISNECDKQLDKVRSSLTLLKPLKEMVSKWNFNDDVSYQVTNLTNKEVEDYKTNLNNKEDGNNINLTKERENKQEYTKERFREETIIDDLKEKIPSILKQKTLSEKDDDKSQKEVIYLENLELENEKKGVKCNINSNDQSANIFGEEDKMEDLVEKDQFLSKMDWINKLI